MMSFLVVYSKRAPPAMSRSRNLGAGEMALWLRVSTALVGNISSVSSTLVRKQLLVTSAPEGLMPSGQPIY